MLLAASIIQSQANRLLYDVVADVLQKYGFDPRLWSILSVIEHSPSGTRNTEIAAQLHIEAALVTMRSKELFKMGYIVSQVSTIDSRAKLVSMTPKGKKFIDKVNSDLSNKLSQTADGVSDQQLETYFSVLQTIIKNTALTD